MKARLHPTPALQKAVDEYAEEKIKGIQAHAHEAIMKERNDIATRATYNDAGKANFTKEIHIYMSEKKNVKTSEKA